MKAKRPTKAQREEAEIQAIEKRLRDILQGAQGGYSLSELDDPDGNNCINQIVGIEAFGRFMGAVQLAWPSGAQHWIYSFTHLKHFDTLRSSAEYLHKAGMRA